MVISIISEFQQNNKVLTKVIKYSHTVLSRMAFTFGASTSKPSFGSCGTTAKTTESNVLGGFSTTTTTFSSGNVRLFLFHIIFKIIYNQCFDSLKKLLFFLTQTIKFGTMKRCHSNSQISVPVHL